MIDHSLKYFTFNTYYSLSIQIKFGAGVFTYICRAKAVGFIGQTNNIVNCEQ